MQITNFDIIVNLSEENNWHIRIYFVYKLEEEGREREREKKALFVVALMQHKYQKEAAAAFKYNSKSHICVVFVLCLLIFSTNK